MATKAQAFIGRKVRHYIRDLGMAPKQAVRVAYEQARKKGFRVGRPTKKNVDTFALRFMGPVVGPALEKAAATSVRPPRARKAKKASRRGRSRRRNPLDASEVISFWREYADSQDFTRKAIDAGVSEIKSDPEYWASGSMAKLADLVGAWSSGRASENPLGPVIGDHVLAVEYRGGEGKKKGSIWRHDFSRAGAKVIGLKDGSVLIKRGKRPLWRYFK